MSPDPEDRRAGPRPGLPPGRAAAVAAIVTAFILYGSLYPFQLRPPPAGAEPFAALLGSWRQPAGGHGDLVANLVLYAPSGFFAATGLLGRLRRPVLLLLLLTLGGGPLSFAVELAQGHIAGRTSSLWDVALNTLGCALGALAATLPGAGRLAAGAQPGRLAAQPFAALLVLSWLGYRLYPYVPTIDLQEYRASLKPLLLAPGLEPFRSLRLAVLWLLAAHLIETVTGRRRARLLVPLVLIGTLAAGVPIVGRALTLPDLLGVALALPGWWMLRASPRQGPVLLTLTLAVLLAERLSPFRFGEAARAFDWVPFLGLLQGEWGVGLQSMLQKVFLYGGLLWLLVQWGLPLMLAAGIEVALLFATSLAQTRLPGRSAEITDSVLAAGLALVFALLRPSPAVTAAAPRRQG